MCTTAWYKLNCLLSVMQASKSSGGSVFKQLGFDPGHRLAIQSDEMAAGVCTKSRPNVSTKLKHVDIHQHWLRERV